MLEEPSQPTPYVLVTAGIEVSVWPSYEGKKSHFDTSVYTYSYTIKIRNNSGDSVQLKRRTWRITDAFGREEVVEGPGVVGQEPMLSSGKSFLYASFCPLLTPTGSMVGFFEFVNSVGRKFKVDVPQFLLQNKMLMN